VQERRSGARSRDPHFLRGLLIIVLVPVASVLGMVAGAGAGSGADARAPVTAVAQRPTARTVAPPPVAPAPDDEPAGAVAPAPATPAATATEAAPAPPQRPAPGPSTGYAPPGTERVDVGVGAQGAAIFRQPAAAAQPRPVVIFLHGWVAIDPRRYGSWIGHLVRGGATVIYPAYQTKPAYDTIAPLGNVLDGVRTALEQVQLAPGRLVVAGHSAGAALSADYATVATANALPAPAAVFSVYPGRKLSHLAVPIPSADLTTIAPGTRVLAYAGERDTAVGSGTAARIVAGATQARAHATLQIIRDDAVDDHSAPRRADRAARRTFWEPLDALVAATATNARDTIGPVATRAR
jgi:acetyl esterase/lipase